MIECTYYTYANNIHNKHTSSSLSKYNSITTYTYHHIQYTIPHTITIIYH